MDTQLLATIMGGAAVAVLIWVGRLIVRAIHALWETTQATKDLGAKFDSFTPVIDGRLSRLERMTQKIWEKLFPSQDPPA